MSLENSVVESLAESLVREYLNRKGLKSTLRVMDEEYPRSENGINNRQILVKELHLDELMKKNKEQKVPLKAMLEVMTKFFLERLVTENMDNTQHPTTRCVDERYLLPFATAAGPISRRASGRGDQDIVIEDNIESETILGQGKAGLLSKKFVDEKESSSYSKQTRPLSSKGRSGIIMSTMEDPARWRWTNKSKPNNNNNKIAKNQQTMRHSEADFDTDLSQTNGEESISPSLSSTKFWDQIGFPQPDIPTASSSCSVVKEEHSMPSRSKSSSFQELLNASEEKANQFSRRLSNMNNECEISDKSYNAKTSSFAKERPFSQTSTSKPGFKPASLSNIKNGEIEIGDVDDAESEVNDIQLKPAALTPQRMQLKTLDSMPIDKNTAVSLKTLVFGTASQVYCDEWRLQSFTFCNIPQIQYGIVQRKGGPCGVLASVQAVFLQEMLFGENKLPSSKCLRPTKTERSEFLAKAVAKILWRAGNQTKAVVAVPSMQCHIPGTTQFKQDEVTEKLVLYNFKQFSELLEFLKQSIHEFERDGSSGVILCMYSAILSRGVEKVRSDMDEPNGRMIAAHGYCTQELVNLLLTGQAVSNVFNDVMELDSGTGNIVVLRGISGRSETGFLSLFEHYKSCQVGTYYKTPKYPIWVVCSESHFSVLFSTRHELVSDWKAERRFDLFYYDGLARQQEEIRLTICGLMPKLTGMDMNQYSKSSSSPAAGQ
ncbi:hypothetical protein C0Q70_09335 [Pomacea canaliculata]|uniref:Ubiquitin carboxyl-terminal hydrolase MINDY n=1 Tax=Pomacea canaliculata TaxID=400727 RepID=A0A2T7P9I2_POMCA|nr:hypothetical protein C0Q70_09335 [Pomacea canaliculata]